MEDASGTSFSRPGEATNGSSTGFRGAKSPAFPFTGTRDDSPFPFRSRSGLPKPYFFFMGKHILLNVLSPLSRLWSICAFLALSLAFREFLDHLRSCYASGQGRERELWHAMPNSDEQTTLFTSEASYNTF